MKKKFRLLLSLLMAMGVMGAASACDVNTVIDSLKDKIPSLQLPWLDKSESEDSTVEESQNSDSSSEDPTSSDAPTTSEDPTSSDDPTTSEDPSSSEDSSSSEDPTPSVPEDGATLTIPEVLALDIEAAAGNKYYVEGTVVRYSDAYKGGLYIQDAEGNELCIYGLQKVYPPYDEGGEPYVEKFDDMWHEDKPWVGATVKFYGEVGAYKDVNQFVDAEFEILQQPETDPEANLPENGEMLTISEILDLDVTSDTLRQYFVEGVVKEIKNTQFGNLYIEDAEGNELYVYGLYDAFTGDRFDKMEVQPKVGEIISVRSIISVHNGQIQLKNARLCECRPVPLALNLDGDTVIEIPAGEGVYIPTEATTDTFDAKYVISWDESITNLMVNYGMVSNGGVVEAYDGKINLNFFTSDYTALTVTVTLTTYVEPPAPELLVGENAIEVTNGWDGQKVQVTTPGTYTISWADGEENGSITVEGEYGSEMVDAPYTFTVEEGQAFVLIISTANWSADTIDLVLTKEGIEVNTYTVQFLNEDGTLISTATYEEGETVVVPDAPTKAADNTYTYEFAGWDSEVVAVAGDATYKATYTAIYVEYTVNFVDADGNEISKETYHYGDEVVVPDAPAKADSTVYTFEFAGWDSEVVAVADDATYTAKYTATLKAGFNSNMTSASVGESVVLGASSIGAGANYTIGQNAGGSINQSYIAINGEYSFDDYVAFDFTGKNMPEVMFFAKNYDGSMYYTEGKQGVVVASGITLYNGSIGEVQSNNTTVGVSGPFGAYISAAEAPRGGNMLGDFSAQLARANLVDGTQYRVIMGITKASDIAFTLKYMLYNVTAGEVVEEVEQTSWNFFTGNNTAVDSMTLNDLVGSIVLYGKFGTELKIDKFWGVYEDTNINTIANGLNNNATYTVTFKDAEGNLLKEVTEVPFGSYVSYEGDLPQAPEADALFTYSYVWDKPLGMIIEDTVYTLVVKSEANSGVQASNVTVQGTSVVLGAGSIGAGANYTIGQNAGGSVTQAYLGFDGNYGFDNYIVFDFTGKNMPEVMFFAKNYDSTMYYTEGKQGVLVASGITLWDGTTGSAQGNNTKVGVSGPFGAYFEAAAAPYGGNMLSDFDAKLARENLVDGTQYRIVIGMAKATDSRAFTLKYMLYNVTTGEVVEEVSKSSWNFFSGSNAAVGNMTRDELVGSIVLYGKFGTTCTIDALHGIYSGDYATVVETAKSL